jgi:hypothetical protein
MGDRTPNRLLRASLVAGGCGAGLFCLYAAFCNGQSFDNGPGGVMFGIALAAVVFVSWMMLPAADWRQRAGSWVTAWGVRLLWIGAFVFVAGNSAMFAALHRGESVNGKGLEIDLYQTAKADRAKAEQDLKGMEASDLWQATASCALPKGAKAKTFCDNHAATDARIQAAQAVIAKGKPAASDPGAELVAWIIDGDAGKVGRAWPAYLGAVVELIASFCWKFAFIQDKKPAPAVKLEAAPQAPVAEAFDLTAAARALASRPRKPRTARLGQALLPPRAGEEALSPLRQRTKRKVEA